MLIPSEMESRPPASSGLYVVLLDLLAPVRITRPRRALLEPGRYAYVGSARRGLEARVAHHLERRKKGHWHIVQLTTARRVAVIGAVRLTSTALAECALNMEVGTLVGGTTPVRGFGAADCSSGCPAHLWCCGRSPELGWLAETLAEHGLTDVVHAPRTPCGARTTYARSSSR